MPAPAAPQPTWLVACLCAAWCRTCDDYRAVLAAAEREHPEARFVWVDIEDHADALDDPAGAAEDIENFPTLLLSLGDAPYFCGTVLPHAGVLQRLLDQGQRGGGRLQGHEHQHQIAAARVARQASTDASAPGHFCWSEFRYQRDSCPWTFLNADLQK